jgi:hypothetical protein
MTARYVVRRASGSALATAPLVLMVLLSSCTQTNRAATSDTQSSAAADTQPVAQTDTVVKTTPPNTRPTAPAVQSADTIVGRVSEVGADPATWLSLQPSGGAAAVKLTGSVDALRSIGGAEVWVSGARQSDGFRVDAFEVRRVNGQLVDDGVVVVEPDRVDIRMRTGARRAVPNAPTAMRGMAGARIWVTRPAANRAPSYGVIAPQ